MSGADTQLCALSAAQTHNQQVRNDYEAQWQASRDGSDDFARKWGKGVRVPGDRCPAPANAPMCNATGSPLLLQRILLIFQTRCSFQRVRHTSRARSRAVAPPGCKRRVRTCRP